MACMHMGMGGSFSAHVHVVGSLSKWHIWGRGVHAGMCVWVRAGVGVDGGSSRWDGWGVGGVGGVGVVLEVVCMLHVCV